MNRRYSLYAAALALLCFAQVASAQVQVDQNHFPSDNPDYHLINFDTDGNGSAISDGQLLQNAYASIGGNPFHGVHFDANDRARAMDFYGTSSPNQASGSGDDLQSINVYFNNPAAAVGAWGYDFTMRAFDKDGNLLLQISYTDGHVCPEPGNFREQRFLGIDGAGIPIAQVQFSRFYQNQVDCGFRIDDLQFLQADPPPDPTPLAGNIQINWNNCSGQPGSSPYTVFDCDPSLGTVYNLIGSMQVMSPYNDMIAMDASFDIVLDEQTTMPPFWHFESGGCNSLGMSVDDSRPAACGGPYQTPWGAGGSQSDAFITGYQPGVTFGNYGRLVITVARSQDNPISLAAAPVRYFAWSLNFTMDNAGACTGCGEKASVRVNAIKLYHQVEPGSGDQIDQGGPGSQPCASINGGGSSCNPTPTRHQTWGQLKSLYR